MATAKHLDNQGEAAAKLYKKLTDSSKDYNARRKEQTEALRDTLTPVWEALAAGKTVNGCADKLSWCKWANPSAKHPERYFYKLMSDKGLKSVQSFHIVTVKPGMILLIDGVRYKLPGKVTAQHGTSGVTLTGLKIVLRKLRKREKCPECGYTLDVENGKFGKHTHMPGPRSGKECGMSNHAVTVDERGNIINTAAKAAAAA
jgi:hypothetical protein